MPDSDTGKLTAAIAAAIRDHDFRAVRGLISVLAVTDPGAARQVLDSIEAGLRIAAAREGGDAACPPNR